VSLYVSTFTKDGYENHFYELVQDGKIVGLDRVPQLYDFETQNIYLHFNCSKPLYISNQLSFMSAVIKRETPPTMDLWKAFDIKIWILILLALMFTVIADRLLSKSNKSFLDLIWIYLKSIIGIGGRSGYNKFIYLLWILCIFPLTEIFKNDLLANLVAVPNLYLDNIDDLFDDNLMLYTDGYKIGYWKDIIYRDTLYENDFRQKFEKLVVKTKAFDFQSDYWMKILDQPKKLRAIAKKVVIIEDDQSIRFFKDFLSRFIDIHLAEEAYIPKLITPLCYGPQFKFVEETERV